MIQIYLYHDASAAIKGLSRSVRIALFSLKILTFCLSNFRIYINFVLNTKMYNIFGDFKQHKLVYKSIIIIVQIFMSTVDKYISKINNVNILVLLPSSLAMQ